MSVAERVRGVMSRVLEVSSEQVTPDAPRGELPNWDSLRHLDLVMEVEAEFGCSFTMEEMTRIASMGDFVQAVQRKAA